MNKTKIILGGAFILGGYWLIKNFLNKKIEVEKPKIETGFDCPLNEMSEEELKKSNEERERFIKNDPVFGAFKYAEWKAKSTPYWNPQIDCTPEELEDWNKRFEKGMQKLADKGKRGLVPPMLTPFAQKLIEDKFGGGSNPNKDYNRWCGTEVCWVYDNKTAKWIKEN